MVVNHLGDLSQDPENARAHNPRNVGMIEDALGKVGAARSIVIDEDNMVLAGNATIEAAGRVGIERVRVVEADGEEIIAVRRSGLTPEQKKLLAYYDNRTAELADWNPEQLLADITADLDLSDLFHDGELDEILGDLLKDPPEDPGPQIDKAAELQEKWQVERGQIWQVGRHRVMCGDSTSAEDVGRLLDGAEPQLMVTDPPYGVEYDPEWRVRAGHNERTHGQKIQGDDTASWADAYRLFCGDVVYVWHASSMTHIVARDLIECGFEVEKGYVIVWNKDLAVFGRGDYHWKHELCRYSWKKGKKHNFIGDKKQTTVWDIPTIHSFAMGHNAEEWGLVGHGTQKPLECMLRPIQNHTGDVYDPFLGSGTTLVACEQTGRIGYGMEIEPKYVAVTLERLTGLGLEARVAE